MKRLGKALGSYHSLRMTGLLHLCGGGIDTTDPVKKIMKVTAANVSIRRLKTFKVDMLEKRNLSSNEGD